MNVKFIRLTAAKWQAWTEIYKGLFVYLTQDVTKGGSGADANDVVTPKGLYFGGESGWEFLSNDSAAIDAAIDAKIALLDATNVAPLTKATDAAGDVTLTFKGVSETNGVIEQGTGTDTLVLKKVATTGAAEDVTFAQYPAEADLGQGEQPKIASGANLQDVMEAVINSISDANEDAVITLTDASGAVLTGNNAVVHADGTEYQLRQNNEVIAKFNIEKDSFVKSGEIVYGTYSDGTFTPGTATEQNAFIHLAIKTTGDGADAASESDIYIPASSLIEYTTVADSDAYLTDNNHVITVSQKVSDAITKVEGLTVNGQAVAANGTVTVNATQVPMSNAQNAQSVSDAIAAINTEIGDAAVAGESASTGLYKYVDDAINAIPSGYDKVVNANESQYVKVSTKENNQQTLSVEIGSFTDGNTAQVPGLATVQAVETVITANEAVTSNALNALDARLDTLEAETKVSDLDVASNTSDAVAGIAVQVDEEDGLVKTPVVTVADNQVTYTAASGNTAANLAAASTDNVLKGNAIASIKSYVDAKAAESSSAVAALDATNNTSDAVAGVTVQVDEADGVVAKPVVTVADNTVTYTAASGNTPASLAAANTSNVLKGDAIAPIKSYVDAKVDALDATSNTSTKVAGITVQVDEVNGVVSTPVVTVDNNTVTCDSANNTLTAADTTAVLKGDAIAPIKQYVDDAVSDAQMVWLSDLPTA